MWGVLEGWHCNGYLFAVYAVGFLLFFLFLTGGRRSIRTGPTLLQS